MILLESLVKNNILREDQVNEVLKIADEKYEGNIDEALLDFNLDEDKILEIKGTIFNIPIRNIDPGMVQSSVLKLIPVDAAKIYHFLPIGETDNVLEIGVIDPENVQAMDAITFITAKLNKPFKLFLIKTSVYNKILSNYEGLDSQVDQALSELDAEIADSKDSGVTIESNKTSDSLKPGEEEKIVEDAPIIKIVAVILRHAT